MVNLWSGGRGALALMKFRICEIELPETNSQLLPTHAVS